jgi:hypothetical protein
MPPLAPSLPTVARQAQRELGLKLERYQLPVMDVSTAKGFLAMTEDQVLAAIEEQLALIAWNIASPKTLRRELRILTQSVSLYLAKNPERCPEYYCADFCPDTAAECLLDFIDGRHASPRPWIDGKEIQRAMNCGSTHVINLVESKCLKLMPGSDYQRGPGGSPNIIRASFLQFLKTRLIGLC